LIALEGYGRKRVYSSSILSRSAAFDGDVSVCKYKKSSYEGELRIKKGFEAQIMYRLGPT
jgi:hypothetical protein